MAKAKRSGRPKRKRSGTRRSRGKLSKGRRRFRLPSGGKTIYASPERYPRLYEWILNADAEDE